MNFHIHLKTSIVSTILLIIASLSAAILVSLWLISAKVAETVARDIFNATSHSASEKIQNLMTSSLNLATYGAVLPNVAKIEGNGLDHNALPFLFSALNQDPSLYSLYYGFRDKSFLQVSAAKGNDKILKAHEAPQGTYWIVRTIRATSPSTRLQAWSFLGINKTVIEQRADTNPDYDPTTRPWYQSSDGLITPKLTESYVFNSIQQPGLTAAAALANSTGVFGVDVVLDGLNSFIASQPVSANGGIVLFDDKGRLLASSESLGTSTPLIATHTIEKPEIKAILAKHKEHGVIDLITSVQDDVEYLISITENQFDGAKIYTAIIAPSSDFNAHISKMQSYIIVLFVASLLLFIPLALFLSSRLASSAWRLADDAQRVSEMNIDITTPLKSRIIEFNNLGTSFHDMKISLLSNASDLKVSQNKLSRLVELGIAMSSEKNSAKLLEMVLLGAKELTNADGGTIYTISEEGKLDFQILRNDSLGIELGGTSGNQVNIPSVPLFDDDGAPNNRNIVSYTVHQENTVNIEDAYNSDKFDFTGTKVFDENNNYRSKSFLTVPLKPRGGDVIGAMQIINAIDPDTGEVVPFAEEIQPFIEALAAQAATALYNRDLLEAQKNLLDSMITLLAGAIDTKSPYTGGHCERVPELAMLLAKKACEEDQGSLAEFNFANDEEWYEFKIGAWLHDCGKVVTPEYVVDKATKLETIYNRIHEIRGRFEILLRDTEIISLKAILSGGTEDQAQTDFDIRKQKLVDDYNFIAGCNIGGEFLDNDKIERLKTIGEHTWTRNFDDRIGLSHDELERYNSDGMTPAIEKLLDDKDNHVIPRKRNIEDRYAKYNFKVDIPENLYNQGEIYNLSTNKGTLTEEERFKINEHVMQTIAMLESLPFPKHLQRIPEYAGTHHETLEGTGYPRKLNADQLSIPTRIMAIADIFEALTASDRPYKKAKTLSESIKILSFFKKGGHIDGDLFDLFLTSGVYLDYADKFLTPEQMDEVDIDQYVG